MARLIAGSRTSAAVRRLAGRIGAARPTGDAGMTLVEVLIALVLTALVIAVMLPTMIPYIGMISGSRIRSTSTSDTQIVFEQIDSEVRFASAINQQGYGASNIANPDDPSIPAQRARYVEWLTPAESSPTGQALCTQWRFVPSRNAIEERRWNLSATPPPTFTQRLELAIDQPPNATTNENVDAHDRPTYPFAMDSANYAVGEPMQTLTLWVYAGRAADSATTQIRTRFVARNSSDSAATNDGDGSGWGAANAAEIGSTGALYAEPLAGRSVPYVCSAQVTDSGPIPFLSSNPFRP